MSLDESEKKVPSLVNPIFTSNFVLIKDSDSLRAICHLEHSEVFVVLGLQGPCYPVSRVVSKYVNITEPIRMFHYHSDIKIPETHLLFLPQSWNAIFENTSLPLTYVQFSSSLGGGLQHLFIHQKEGIWDIIEFVCISIHVSTVVVCRYTPIN